jgi:hypothetical protein
MSPDARHILLFRLALAELAFELALRRFGQSHHNHAAGRHIQTMHGFRLREIALNTRHHAVFMLFKTPGTDNRPLGLLTTIMCSS